MKQNNVAELQRARHTKKDYLLIGLTGGIGSGKSSVVQLLRKGGFAVVDADKISRDIVASGSPVWREIVRAFGDDILAQDGQLNRKKLAQIVFANRAKLDLLEQLTHPEIKRQLFAEANQLLKKGHRTVFLDVPLLFEMALDQLCDLSWLVVIDKETQIERIMARDQLTRQQILQRIDNQMPQEEKKRRADVIIDNSGSLNQLSETVRKLSASLPV